MSTVNCSHCWIDVWLCFSGNISDCSQERDIHLLPILNAILVFLLLIKLPCNIVIHNSCGYMGMKTSEGYSNTYQIGFSCYWYLVLVHFTMRENISDSYFTHFLTDSMPSITKVTATAFQCCIVIWKSIIHLHDVSLACIVTSKDQFRGMLHKNRDSLYKWFFIRAN